MVAGCQVYLKPTPVSHWSLVVVRGVPLVVAALQVVWLLLTNIASDGFVVFLYRYVGTLASLRHEVASCQIPKIHAHCRLWSCSLAGTSLVALHPQTSDANAAQDVTYACPHGGVCGHFIGVVVSL